MAHDSKAIHVLYGKLLTFYPGEFREQLVESMEQSFKDLYNEERQTERGFLGVILWIFIETGMGIVREHLLLITEGNAMKNMFMNLRSPALISLLLVIPFMVMEIVNRREFNEGFPIPLFGILWLLPLIVIATLMPIVRNVQTGNRLMANPVNLLIRVIILVFVAWMWTGLLIDQMPCFLGVPRCD